jgi:mannitol 2-dehydrogenase
MLAPGARRLRATLPWRQLTRPLAVAVTKAPGVPTYNRNFDSYPNVQVHLGVGGFHRSHQAHYMHELLERPGGSDGWTLCGYGLMPQDAGMADALRGQDHLYTVLSQGPRGSSTTVVGSIMDYVLVSDDPAKAVERLASERVKIVSLTITEKGYCLGVDFRLDLKHALIAAELPVGSPPKSALGLMYAGLAQRKRAGVPPFTIMSCDNMPGNGRIAHEILLQFAQARAGAGDPEAAGIVAMIESGEVAFPSTMVDRITPVTEASHKQLLKDEHGIDDLCPVVAEDFKQWVVEDHFPLGRPAWESVGALMAQGESGVEVYEAMKLRMLNGTHSALSYVSYLSGHRLVSDAMADPAVLGFVSAYLDEVIVTVPQVEGISLPDYRASLIERFSNVHIRDTVLRLAEDGSQKLQTTMRDVLLEQLAAGRDFSTMALAIGGWIKFMSGTDDAGAPIDGIKDPMAARLNELSLKVLANPTAETTGPLLTEFFGEGVGGNERAASAVADAVASLLQTEGGTHAVLKAKYGA